MRPSPIRFLLSAVVLGAWCSVTAQRPELPLAPSQVALATISADVIDPDGDQFPKADVLLTPVAPSTGAPIKAVTDQFGHLSLMVPPGAYLLTVSAPELSPNRSSVTLAAGQTLVLPDIQLRTVTDVESVSVVASPHEMAEAQIKAEEQQRILGVLPNFYVVYDWHPAPLDTQQKYRLATRNLIDPVNLAITGIIAGAQQATETYPGFGYGASGYAKRYAAGFGDFLFGSFFTAAIFPSIFHQDPRYIYKGFGSTRSRIGYALASPYIARSDRNGKWITNYSNLLGSLAAGGLSNAYHPAADRNGAGLTFENAGVGLLSDSFSALVQEFVLPHVTTHRRQKKAAASTADLTIPAAPAPAPASSPQ